MTEIDLKQYRKDAKGNLVPLANIKETDLLRDELVMEIVAKARALRDNIAAFKQRSMDDIAAFAQLSAEKYGAKLGGAKGNIRLMSFDGAYRIALAMQDTLTLDAVRREYERVTGKKLQKTTIC